MQSVKVTLHSKNIVGDVDPRIFGGFLEHIGRAVYQGVYDPASIHADKDEFRKDVLEALRRLNMTVMRYPGGNFASGYHWRDGIGPTHLRPKLQELAWKSIEPNQFGTDEYIKLCRKMGWKPMITVNLGSGSPEEARSWVEYCNSLPGTRDADLRARNSTEPHDVKLWCLGNEMDGPWQIGNLPAEQYALRARQAAKLMKTVDPGIELVACGSSSPAMATYADWDRQVLEGVGEAADYISLHRYVGNLNNDTPDYLAITNSIDRQIEVIDACCRFVQAKSRSVIRTYLCFDEWNVWYKNRQMDGGWQRAPHLVEEIYNLEDALVVTGFINSFIRHADVVKLANIAQIVNVIAPILTRGDEILLQSIFYAFEMFSKRRHGTSLRPIIEGPTYEGKTNGPACLIDTSAILDTDRLHFFSTNRHTEKPTTVQLRLVDRDIVALESGELLTGPNAKAANTFEQPNLVKSIPLSESDSRKLAGGEFTLELPPLSAAALTFRL
ncbi:MAG: alpha-L-arabinofuranosidase C-terminal domain-containing protein [Candidatus Bathyarchaeia archaeon]|jgi:alpha-N-arabinofuranosidase